ncbi:MAG: DUF4833 domain-containing protein [Cyclobacterium sp.]|uniref:DUF4833 domain-containing protein n=1 Tax=Cyclobacterium sp. TaxID=1966343 RepID=UPI003970E073
MLIRMAVMFAFLLIPGFTSMGQQVLFTIERSLNEDQIVYFLQLDENDLPRKDEPISLKWLDNENSGELVPVNWIKKKFGYGINIIHQNEERVDFKFVSYDKKVFTLIKDGSGNYGVFGKINGKKMKIRHIYLKMEGGTFWKPNITEVAVMGYHELANTHVKETFNP